MCENAFFCKIQEFRCSAVDRELAFKAKLKGAYKVIFERETLHTSFLKTSHQKTDT